jgi:hypothetical protein
MQVRIKKDRVEIDGYVNAVERDSKILRDRVLGKFIERIRKGAFRRALERNKDVHVLLNHNWERDLGSTAAGNLELHEDAIGLHARATITDAEVIENARNGDLVGWSFGFDDVPDGVEKTEVDGITHRAVKDLKLYEVSILNRAKSPAYEGTLIMARDDEPVFIGDTLEQSVEYIREDKTETEAEPIDYSAFENIISEMKGETK